MFFYARDMLYKPDATLWYSYDCTSPWIRVSCSWNATLLLRQAVLSHFLHGRWNKIATYSINNLINSFIIYRGAGVYK